MRFMSWMIFIDKKDQRKIYEPLGLNKKYDGTTMYIANKAGSRLLNGSSSMKHRRSFCFGYNKNVSTVPKQKLRLSANLTGLSSERPYLSYTNRYIQ